METYEPQPLEERKSQKLTFLDYAKERTLWQVLPLLAGGAAVALGRVVKIWPLDRSANLITSAHAKIAEHFTDKSHDVVTFIKKGGWVGEAITKMGGENKEQLRGDYFHFLKGAEVAAPFSIYHLWHKKEENRLDLQDVSQKLLALDGIKPTDAELAQQNDVMRKQLAFAGKPAPQATIDPATLQREGRVEERQRERA